MESSGLDSFDKGSSARFLPAGLPLSESHAEEIPPHTSPFLEALARSLTTLAREHNASLSIPASVFRPKSRELVDDSADTKPSFSA